MRALNQVLNVFWTLLAFTPVLWFWILRGVSVWLYVFLGISLLFALLPQKILEKFVLGKKRRTYEKWGVKRMRRWVQDGDWVRAQRAPRIDGPSAARGYLRTLAMYERFHWLCLIFFLGTALLAFVSGHFLLGLCVTLANFLYNFMAILLQQYNRLRLAPLVRGLAAGK